MRAAIYARYSSDNQKDSSIEDQVRVCRTLVDREGWQFGDVYSDHAISGTTTLRPGYQKMLEDARAGHFQVLVAEALDRLSRDQENIAGLFKQLCFADVKLLTFSEGQINELHVGLKGTMNALFIKDLAQKTHRGLEGRIRQGKSGGGRCYGYDVVRKVDLSGEPIRGERQINDAEAEIVRRIFEEFSKGRSPSAIAKTLNKDSVPGPAGKDWGPSTIYGNWRRGTGILNNELYIGRLVWNRQRYIKDPDSGKRQARLNPENKWIIEDVSHLRIIDDLAWSAAKKRQNKWRSRVENGGHRVTLERARRPQHLLSGLIKCGVCGGGFSKISKVHYGCSTARKKGTCENMLTVRQDYLEARVLDGLKRQLMAPELVQTFVEEFHKELNRQAAEQDQARDSHERELEKIKRGIKKLIDAIKSGVPGGDVKDEMIALGKRRRELEYQLERTPAPSPRLHPHIAEVYKEKVAKLEEALNEEKTKIQAAEAIRSLIDEIRLVPEKGQLRIELFGELAALINLTNKSPGSRKPGVQVTMVAGAGFEPATFRL